MLDTATIQSLAAELREARRTRQQVRHFSKRFPGMTVEDGKIDVGDLLATLVSALGIDLKTQNVSEVGRPFKVAEGKAIQEVLA